MSATTATPFVLGQLSRADNGDRATGDAADRRKANYHLRRMAALL